MARSINRLLICERNSVRSQEPMAVWSLVLGVLSIFPLSFLEGIPAVITGHISRANIRRSNGELGGGGQALAGLIMGYFSVVLPIVYFAIVLTVAWSLMGTHASVKAGADPVGDIRALNTAIMTYKTKFSSYPPSLKVLGPNYSGKDSAEAAGLVDFSLAVGLKDGYLYRYERSNGDEGYTLQVDPFSLKANSGKHFYSDQTGVVRYDAERKAGPESNEISLQKTPIAPGAMLLTPEFC